jgi:hypothetical protein
MRAFVNNLESSKGLEDGVDIADSYASISETIKPIAAKMLENVNPIWIETLHRATNAVLSCITCCTSFSFQQIQPITSIFPKSLVFLLSTTSIIIRYHR